MLDKRNKSTCDDFSKTCFAKELLESYRAKSLFAKNEISTSKNI